LKAGSNGIDQIFLRASELFFIASRDTIPQMFISSWFSPKGVRSQEGVFRENELLKTQIQELLQLEETGFFIELDTLLKAILKKALILCKADSSFFALTQKDPTELDVRISNLILEEKMERIREAFKQEYPSWVESERELIPVDDFILLPLMRRHKLLGVIGLKLNPDAPENVCEILPMLAKQAANSLESAILYERMLKRLLVLSNVFILGKEIISNIDLGSLVNKFLGIARDGTSSEIACIFLLKEKESHPYFSRVQTSRGEGEFIGKDGGFSPLVREAFEKREIMIIPNLENYSNGELEINKISNFKLRDSIILPMSARDKFLGVIQVANKVGRDPFSNEDLDLLKILCSQIAFVIQNSDLFQNLQKAYIDTLGALTSAIDAKDSYTSGHSQRVTNLSVDLGREVALSREDLENVRIASLLHDIGKIGIPETILNKPGRLNDEEFEIIKSHTTLGVKILENVEFLEQVLSIILHHHERFDGKGYPAKISGETIPLGARIITVADTYDAMTSDRPYRKALSAEAALAEIARCKGTQFDPEIAEAFIKMMNRNRTNISPL